jgi:hypothetical protein
MSMSRMPLRGGLSMYQFKHRQRNIANVVWHSTGRDLPGDTLRVHRLRTLFRQYSIEKYIIVFMAGASPRTLKHNIYGDIYHYSLVTRRDTVVQASYFDRGRSVTGSVSHRRINT